MAMSELLKDVGKKLTCWTGRYEGLYGMISRLVYHWAFASGEDAYFLPTPPQVPIPSE